MDLTNIFEPLSVLRGITLAGVVDILLVALVFYLILRLFQGTQAIQLLRGMILLILIISVLSSLLRLRAFTWLIRNSFAALLVALPVIFQPELRRGLERLGRTGSLRNLLRNPETVNMIIEEIVDACELMADRRHGALIVLERVTGLQDYVETGAPVDAPVSSELLQTIFYPSTPLHDGAVIIRAGRIAAARVVLPLAEHAPAYSHLGTRHRAAIGITEQSDALAIVVSEETGIISVAQNGRMIRRLGRERLANVLRSFYRLSPGGRSPLAGITRWFSGGSSSSHRSSS